MSVEEAIKVIKRYRDTILRDFSCPDELEAYKDYTVAIESMEKEVQNKHKEVNK